MAKDSPEDILSNSFYNVQNGIWSVMYELVEHVMLELLCKDVIGEKFHAQIAKFFDTDVAVEVLSKWMLTFRLSIAPITTFVSRKSDTAVEKQKYNTILARK